MAKRARKVEPAPHVEDEQDETTIGGFPDHGDEFRGVDPDPGPSPDDDRKSEPRKDDPLAEFRHELASLRRQNEELHRALAAHAVNRQEPKREEEEPDWEDLLFRDPKKALELRDKMVEDRIERKLTAKYQQVTRTEQFWNNFYSVHPDLKEDKDLVDATFNGNLNKLKDLPVDDAMDKLADLTRERIARYTGRRLPPTRKVRIEGAGGPQLKPPPRQEATITTLSDLIRARRERRRKAATA